MNVHHYDRETGLYLGAGQPDPDPMEPGKFLFPAFCTTEAPPAFAAEQLARFVDSAWRIEQRPQPPPPKPIEPPTPAQIRASRVSAVQMHMDATALVHGYDNLVSAVTYAEEDAVPRFRAEGRAFRRWRSLVWAACIGLEAEVAAGTRPVPTESELIALLPAYEAPFPPPGA